MFLYKLYRFGYTTQKAVGGSRGEYPSAVITRSAPDGYRIQEDIFSRVPAVFIIALGNYVVPCAPVPIVSPSIN